MPPAAAWRTISLAAVRTPHEVPRWRSSLDDGPLSVPFMLTLGRVVASAELRAVVASYQTLGTAGRTITVQSLHDVHARVGDARHLVADDALEALLASRAVAPDWAASSPASTPLLWSWRRLITLGAAEAFRLTGVAERRRHHAGAVALAHPERCAPPGHGDLVSR